MESTTGRSRVEQVGGELRLRIPAKRHWFILPFLVVWLIGWGFGEVMVFGQLANPDAPLPFLLLWLTLWSIGGLFALGFLAWSLVGFEEIRVTGEALVLARCLLGGRRERLYRKTEVRRLRVPPFPQGGWLGAGAPSRQMLRSTILFDYGHKTVGFGDDLDEAEARALVETLAAQLPLASRES